MGENRLDASTKLDKFVQSRNGGNAFVLRNCGDGKFNGRWHNGRATLALGVSTL